jgi:hypothetical protein
MRWINMASFQKYSTKEGQRWLFKMYTTPDPETGEKKPTTRRGFKTKKEAMTAAAKMEQEIENGVLINNNNFTYEEVFNQWFQNHTKILRPAQRKRLNLSSELI